MNKEDKLVIAGHEFSSRFILGSGKYSMKLIEAAVKYAGAEIITLAVRRANSKEHESILDFPILRVQETPKRLSESRDLRESLAAVILSK